MLYQPASTFNLSRCGTASPSLRTNAVLHQKRHRRHRDGNREEDILRTALRHKSVPSRSVLGCQHNRTALTQNGSGSIKIDVCAKTEPPGEQAPHGPASLDFSFPNFSVPEPSSHIIPSTNPWALSAAPLARHTYKNSIILTNYVFDFFPPPAQAHEQYF